MNCLTKEITMLSQIGASLAAGNFTLLESKIIAYKVNKFTELKLYECILQCYLFCGFPSAIESMRIFKKHYTKFKRKKSEYNYSKFKAAGSINCKLIYKKNYKKLIENINSYSPDLREWMIVEGYGKVFNRSGLSLIEREMINVAVLCIRYFENQLHSHMKGCINLGTSREDLKKLLSNIKSIAGIDNYKKANNLLDKLSISDP